MMALMIASLLYDLDWVLPLRHDWLTPVFKAFTVLGFTEFFFAALPLLYWCWNKESGNRIAVLTLIGGLLTLFFKALFEDPRPPVAFAIEGTRPESYGLPSGHTLMSIVFWGSLALESGKRWAVPVAIFFILGISFSRLYLGVHDLEDVLGGALLGLLLLAALILKKRSRPGCCGGRIAFAALFLIPLVLLLLWPKGEPGGKMLLVTGFYLAWLVGSQIEQSRVLFSAAGGWKRIPVGLAGFIILILLAYTLRSLLVVAGLTGSAAPLLGGAMIGFSIAALIPWLLIRLRLLQRSNS